MSGEGLNVAQEIHDLAENVAGLTSTVVEQHKATERRIEALEQTLYGNGRDGIKQRFGVLESNVQRVWDKRLLLYGGGIVCVASIASVLLSALMVKGFGL